MLIQIDFYCLGRELAGYNWIAAAVRTKHIGIIDIFTTVFTVSFQHDIIPFLVLTGVYIVVSFHYSG